MGLLLFWLGLIWMLVGVMNFVSEMGAPGAQLFSVLLFILPGLIAVAIGAKRYAHSRQG